MSRRVRQGLAALRHRLRRKGLVVAAGVLVVLLGENAAQAASVTLLSELGKMAMISGCDAAGPALTPTLTTRIAATAGRIGARFNAVLVDLPLTFVATCLVALALAVTGYLIDHRDSFDGETRKPTVGENRPPSAHHR